MRKTALILGMVLLLGLGWSTGVYAQTGGTEGTLDRTTTDDGPDFGWLGLLGLAGLLGLRRRDTAHRDVRTTATAR